MEVVAQKRMKKRKPKAKPEDLFNVPGVHKLVLDEDLQRLLKCEVGVDVSVENPWVYLNFRDVLDHLQTSKDSVFTPYKSDLDDFPLDNLLVGYIPDETNDYDEFYVCVTEEAQTKISALVDRLKEEQYKKLNQVVVKTSKPWLPQGSDHLVVGIMNLNTRPLLQILIESKYPIYSGRSRFRISNSMNYTELTCDQRIPVISKRRIDNWMQAAPTYTTREAQTVCTFPRNATTQYNYQYDQIEPEPFGGKVSSYFERHSKSLTDMLTINGSFNLYTYDYSELLARGQLPSKRDQLKVKEFMSYSDIRRCRGRMVEAMTWHPLFSWIFVVAYSSYSSYHYISNEPTDDEVFRAVHDPNYVLVWSLFDYMSPVLILEAPREVMNLSFCPYDGNVLIGGCKNGQILIWDIRDKIKPYDPILNLKQKSIRQQIYLFLNWEQFLQPIEVVRPILTSDLTCSHKSPIVGIRWRSPFHDFTKTGRLIERDDTKISMQFESCSLDGTINLWDMVQKLSFKDTAKLKQLRRLKRKPSALRLSESPYKNLDLRPIYTVNVSKDDKNLLVTHASIKKYSNLTYQVENLELKDEGKAVFHPIINRSEEVYADMHIGTMKGEYGHIKWDGQQLDDDELVPAENCQFLNYSSCHDGPVVQTAVNESGTVLTVGGTIFALWRDECQHGPVLWRKVDDLICQGRWHSKSGFSIIKSNGFMEYWRLEVDSNNRLDQVVLNIGSNLIWKEQPRSVNENLFAAGDEFGNLRLHLLDTTKDQNSEELDEFICREVKARNSFNKWQKEWCDRYIIKPKEIKVEEKKLQKEEEATKPLTNLRKPIILKEFQKNKIKWDNEYKKRIQQTIKNKKKLDINELKWQKEPYEQLEKHKLEKKLKQIEINKRREELFKFAVETIFPAQEKMHTEIDPYSFPFSDQETVNCFSCFENICLEAEEFIKNNPYEYEYSMEDAMSKVNERRRKLFEAQGPIHPHKLRLIEERQKKLEEEKRLEEEQQAALKLKQEQEEAEKKKAKGRLKMSGKLKVAKELITEISGKKDDADKNESLSEKSELAVNENVD